jgi:hypothetical protein
MSELRRLRSLIATGTLVNVLLGLPALLHAQSVDEQQPRPEAAREVVVRAFGAVEWGATERQESPNSFTLGQFALFATSNLTERISVLAEVVMEGGVDTRVVTDLERLQLTFRWNDHLHVTAGRYHTGIGFYNTAFHHGAFFETPIGRPRVFAFEDEGGVLPVHDVGMTVRGRIPRTGSGLNYLVEVGNGRSWATDGHNLPNDAEGVVSDQNESKATNVGLSYRHERLPGLEVGGSYYRDTIPHGTLPAVRQRIAAAYVAYRTPTVEVLAEWLTLSHRTPAGTRRDAAGYAQASTALGVIRPYYRYDRLAISPGTPFIGALGSFTAHTVGLRIDPSEWVGFKAQYERADFRSQRGVDAVRTQLVFVF